MCGIAGKIILGSGEIKTSELKLMSQKIIHRGPDDEGFFISKNKKVGLANRRLAIIDLTKSGHQPMFYKNRYVITYNGEVYNFLSEKKILEKEGYHFDSNTDTEVILALYDKYKEKCLSHLNGMFAFAIYDTYRNTIFFARDRLGKKPLKYYFKNGIFIFASELKAIITQKEVKSNPNWQDINDYLTYGYVPAPNTGFENIHKLEPGFYMMLDLNKKHLFKSKYWTVDYNQKLNLSEDQWCEKLFVQLEEATKLRMISDVPIGAFLSGGVDSSAVVAMMARNSNKPIKTFTIIFKEKIYNEKEHAMRIVKKYKTDHHEFFVKPESVELLPVLAAQYEEPYADSSAIITFMVSKLAKKYVTVILNGDGGDENFAGYDRYSRLKRDVLLDNIQPFVRPWAIPLSKMLSKRAYKFLLASKLNLADRFVNYNCFFNNYHKKNIYQNAFQSINHFRNSYIIARNKFLESKASDKRDRASYFDISVYFPNDLLAKVDIATMAVSLEARSPLLDYHIVELATKIPFDLKLKGYSNFKYIFKKSLESIIPRENLYRKKVGFTIPLSSWFTGNLNSFAKSILLKKNSSVSKFINIEVIKKMLDEHTELNDYGPKLWNLLSLELWFKEYFS